MRPKPNWAEQINSAWNWQRLSDVSIDIVDCPHSTPEIVPDGPYLMARTSDILTGVFRGENARRVSEDTYRERTRRAVPRSGDLLFSREGTYFGLAAKVPLATKVCLGQRMVLIRPDHLVVDPSYLTYWLNGPTVQAHIESHRDGSVAERLNLPTIRNLPIAVPSFSEQRGISNILGALDDKIELNRRMSQTLEEIARALFKSWFVDFDPVHAKAAGREPVGMDAETAALFPSEFEESELGLVPKGWETGRLSELASLNSENWTRTTYPDQIAYADLTGTKWGRIETVTEYEREDAPSRAQRVLRSGDTIVGTVRPGNGAYALVAETGLTGSTGFAVLRPHMPDTTEFTYLAATSERNIQRLSQLADGGAYPAVRPDVVSATNVAVPSQEIMKAFSVASSSLLGRIAVNNAQSQMLTAIRDALLPHLLTGNVSIPSESVDSSVK